jgi:hypothetical protein
MRQRTGNESVKHKSDMVEGPEAWKGFEDVMKGVLAVPGFAIHSLFSS